jgi:hypothetical protein
VLRLAKAGTAGVGKGVLPVLDDDGAVVATLDTAKVREAARARIGDREWVFTRRGREMIGRRADDPEDTARFRAVPLSAWKGTWEVDLEGTRLRLRPASVWRGTHRYERDGRVVAENGFSGRWLRLPTLTTHEPLPLEAQVFLLWVELVLTRRSATAAAVAGGSVATSGLAA